MLEEFFNRNLRHHRRDQGVAPGFSPLTEDGLSVQVPAGPGLYMLSFRTGAESYHTFHINQAENLYERLRSVMLRAAQQTNSSPETPSRQIDFYFLIFPLPADGKRCDIERIFASAICGDEPIGVISTN